MKTFIHTLTPGAKVLAYFIMLWLATMLAGIIPPLNDFWFYFIVALIVSSVFLRTEGKTLVVLGILPTRRVNWLQLLIGIAAGCLMLVITACITLYLTANQWHVNQRVNPVQLFMVFAMCFWSALVQEFVFRGYPFQTLLNRYGAWRTQLIIAVPFGLMHLHYNMNLKTMAIVMLTTGLGSVLFGLAYIKTRNLMLPIGLHLGWNYAQALIPRTAGATGNGLITVTGNTENYSSLVIIAPYLLVITASMVVLMFLRTNGNTTIAKLA